MGGTLVLNLIRTTIVGAIGVLLFITVAQEDHEERRLRDLQSGLAENTKRLEKLEQTVRERTIPGGETGHAERRADSDPRTLPYWPTPDNLLVDPANEPAPPRGAPRGGTINFSVGSNPRSLNRYVLNEAQLTDRIVAYVHERIARRSFRDPDRFVPQLANRVTVNEAKTVFTVYLRKGSYWHPPHLEEEEKQAYKWLADLPPQEVTADDVKFTFDVITNPLSEVSTARSYFMDFDRVEVVDRHTLRVHWKKARYYNYSTTVFQLHIYPKFIYGRDRTGKELPAEQAAQIFQQHWYNQRMCGTGPFRFDGFVQNQYVRLRRWPDYWGIRPAVDEIVLHIIEDADVRLQKFKAGDIDLAKVEPAQYRSEYLDGGPGSLKEMVDKGVLSLHHIETFAYYYVGWNMRRPLFRDAQVRRALAHVFPKERVIRDVYYGLGVAHNSPIHRSVSAYARDLERYAYDLEKASAMLDEAGWRRNAKGIREKVLDGTRTELRLKLLFPTIRPVYRKFALLYQKELEKVGVILELQGREWQKMLTQLNDKDFDACSLGWRTTWDSDPAQIWHSKMAKAAKSSNHVSFMNAKVDAAIEGLQTEFDLERRKELWRTFQREIVADQPYIFLLIPRDAWFVSNRLGNQQFNRIAPQQWLVPWYVKEPR